LLVDKLKSDDVKIGIEKEILVFRAEMLADKQIQHLLDFWTSSLYLPNPFK
jgi:sRNA-binding carbon storage regulator CsrA